MTLLTYLADMIKGMDPETENILDYSDVPDLITRGLKFRNSLLPVKERDGHVERTWCPIAGSEM